MSAGALRQWRGPLPLPTIEEMASVPVEQMPSMLIQLAALQSALAARLAIPPAVSEPQAPGKLVTAEVVGEAMSMRTDRVYELARTRRIPSIRIGRAMRFDLQAVRDALSSLSVSASKRTTACDVSEQRQKEKMRHGNDS